MNFAKISKMIMNGERLYNIPLRVCFYARVSTDNDTQLNSLENQLNYYKDYIKSKKAWRYINGYIDEGISGVRVEKRTAFINMIKDAKLGKFDLIITKEVSRFARDLEDSIHYIRILKEANVGIFFENQNLNTFDSNSELILNIMFNLAQDESRKLSSRIKFGHKEAIKKGHVLGSSNIIGYKKDKCKLVIVEEEAQFIKKVFELYTSEKYGFYKLSQKLGELGFYNKNGNLYDKDTLKRIIENPKYKGFYRGNTTETIDYRTKKRTKIDTQNQVIYKCSKNIIPPIVSEELWNSANIILKSRTKINLNNNHFKGGLKYPFSSKIYCKEHNKSFQRSHGNKNKTRPTWSCGMYLQYRLNACFSPIIAESDLYNIFSHIFNSITPKNDIIKDMINSYKNLGNTNQYDVELKVIDQKIKIIENKKNIALDLLINGDLKKEDLKVQFDSFKNDIKTLNIKRETILKQMHIQNENKFHNEQIIKSILNEINNESLGDFIRKFVTKIIVFKIDNDRYNIKLNIYLNLLDNKKETKYIEKNSIIYAENKKYSSIENLRSDKQKNKFTCNIYYN